jgi:hypothetical protein
VCIARPTVKSDRRLGRSLVPEASSSVRRSRALSIGRESHGRGSSAPPVALDRSVEDARTMEGRELLPFVQTQERDSPPRLGAPSRECRVSDAEGRRPR